MRQECERHANDGNYAGADEAGPGCVSVAGGSCGDNSGQQAAGENRCDPGGMVVPLRAVKLRILPRRQIEVDANNAGAVEAKADTWRISGRVAIQVLVGSSGIKTVHRWTIIVANNDWLIFVEVFYKISARWRIRRGRWRVGQRLCGQRGGKATDCDKGEA
jgi:hypothetical protein